MFRAETRKPETVAGTRQTPSPRHDPGVVYFYSDDPTVFVPVVFSGGAGFTDVLKTKSNCSYLMLVNVLTAASEVAQAMRVHPVSYNLRSLAVTRLLRNSYRAEEGN
ncbi:hypothetical protein J6590_020223 [Homalodisca vitripennis]|nr:hypothetical protein J6590_020223 [Homalodisca vitripennis]